jgi:hypothetical protein
VVVELNADDGSLLDQRVVSFMVGGTQAPEAGALTQFRDWISANPLGAVAVAILGFGLLIAVILGAIALIGRARRR